MDPFRKVPHVNNPIRFVDCQHFPAHCIEKYYLLYLLRTVDGNNFFARIGEKGNISIMVNG